MGSTRTMDDSGLTAENVRLDVWLDVSCLFKTRSAAQKACASGKIDVNGQAAKAHRQLRVGDALRISWPYGRKQLVVVRGLAENSLPKADARQLYEDLTPAPSPEEIEMRRMERIYRAQMTPPKAPDKRQRRALRAMKERS